MSSHRLITKRKSAVTRIRCKLRSSNEVANNRSGVIRLGNRHGHRIALVRVFRLLDSHLRSDVSVLCWLVTNFREKRSSQAKAHCAGGRYDGEENKYLFFLARTKRNANEFKRNLLTAIRNESIGIKMINAYLVHFCLVPWELKRRELLVNKNKGNICSLYRRDISLKTSHMFLFTAIFS